MTSIKEIEDAGYKLHHTARAQGYVSRKDNTVVITPYSGKFGDGYKVKKPAFDSTRYCFVSYYVK